MSHFVNKLTPKNPEPSNAKASDKVKVGDKIDMECGYAVLDRADPTSYDRSRRGIAPPVRDFPNISYDEE